MEQINAPVYAGTCAWCYCTYDSLGRRVKCLSEEEASRLMSRGMCGTCRVVTLWVAAAKAQRQDDRAKGFGATDFEGGVL